MKRIAVGLAILLCLGALAGCNTLGRQPQLREAMVTPSTLKPSDSGVVTVKVVDRHRIVTRVVGVVREDTRMKFKLSDDGVSPDEKAGDGEVG